MSSAETEAHLRLKQLAAAWAWNAGYDSVADEVRIPRAAYRADVLAARTTNSPRALAPLATLPQVALFECKQARADLLKDAVAEEATRVRLEQLHVRRLELETLLAVHRPDLRLGETLFPEFDRFDFSDLRHDGYQSVIAEITQLKTALYERTKFAKLVRWNAAHACYVVAEPGICTAAEVPHGWGLLVRDGETLVETQRAARLECPDPWASVASIARAGTRRLRRAWKIGGEQQAAGSAEPVDSSTEHPASNTQHPTSKSE